MVMPEEIPKEAIEFMTRFFGGTASALTENAFEWYYSAHPEARNQFPFTKPAPQLPVWYPIIVGGISIGEALLGLGIEEDPLKVLEGMDFKTKESLKEFGKGLRKFGEGGVLYSAPMLTRRTICLNIPIEVPGAGGQERTEPATRQGRVIKL